MTAERPFFLTHFFSGDILPGSSKKAKIYFLTLKSIAKLEQTHGDSTKIEMEIHKVELGPRNKPGHSQSVHFIKVLRPLSAKRKKKTKNKSKAKQKTV